MKQIYFFKMICGLYNKYLYLNKLSLFVYLLIFKKYLYPKNQILQKIFYTKQYFIFQILIKWRMKILKKY